MIGFSRCFLFRASSCLLLLRRMGAHLSSPRREKVSSYGGDATSSTVFGCASMQGWRISMEDAHLTMPSVPLGDLKIALYGVFDGHGGTSVSNWAAENFASILDSQYNLVVESCKSDKLTLKSLDAINKSEAILAESLQGTFFKIDEELAKPETDLVLQSIAERVRSESGDVTSAQAQADANLLRVLLPDKISSRIQVQNLVNSLQHLNSLGHVSNGVFASDGATKANADVSHGFPEAQAASAVDTSGDLQVNGTSFSGGNEGDFFGQGEALGTSNQGSAVGPQDDTFNQCSAGVSKEVFNAPIEPLDAPTSYAPVNDYEDINRLEKSDNAVEEDEDDDDDNETLEATLDEASTTFVKGVGIPSGHLLHGHGHEEDEEDAGVAYGCGAASVVVAVVNGPKPSVLVANAGDSRAVLCRGGKAIALSHDHKPQLAEEGERIKRAGGCITNGRVDGNLNLSRAIGDLSFKRDTTLTPAQQRITAQPDVRICPLVPQDEFLVLACDGIWDCKTNQQVVDFVRSRLHAHRQKVHSQAAITSDPDSSANAGNGNGVETQIAQVLAKICEDLCDECLSTNPNESEGVGCDNMTVVIVLLQPHFMQKLSQEHASSGDSSIVLYGKDRDVYLVN